MTQVDWTVFSPKCPSRESLARIANKWTAMIVILLDQKPRRFGELHREIGGISKKVLTDTLRALERDGMLVRPDPDDGSPAYRLTPLGGTLRDPLIALQHWAESHVDDVVAAQRVYDERVDGEVLPEDSGDGTAADSS